MFAIHISLKLLRTLSKLKQKDPSTFNQLKKKMIDIASSDEQSIHHYKNLRHPLQEYKRVHIKNHVLLFRFKDNAITFESFEHHDTVYDKEYFFLANLTHKK